MITKAQIDYLLHPALTDDMYLVDIQVSAGNKIVVQIDSIKGVSIDDCVNVSRAIEGGLDREVEDFELEVSSPGLTQPFLVIQQYKKNIGKEVEVLKKDGIKLKAVLTGVAENGIDIEYQKQVKPEGSKKKQTITEKLFLGFDQIKHTKLILSFK